MTSQVRTTPEDRTRPARSSRLVIGAVLGMVSAGAGLAVSELLSGWLHQRASPVVALAESVIRLTPGAVIEHVISLVGHNDKPLLVSLTLLGLALASSIVGVLALRNLILAELIFLIMGVVLATAVHARLTSSPVRYVPAIAGVAVAMFALAQLAPRAVRVVSPGPIDTTSPADGASTALASREQDLSRRRFLATAGVVAAGALVVGATGRWLARSRAAVEAARHRLRLPITARPAPSGADLGVDGVAPWVTSQQDFYRIDTALAVPQVLPAEWRLRIHGMVERELTMTYQDLLDRGLQQAWITLCCVSNQVGGGLISNASWSGVPIADVLADVGLHPDADAVLSTSADGWTAGTPLSVLTDGRDAMFAVAMNGQPLTLEHGFPVRMVVPGLYGYVSGTKWVVDLEVSRFDRFSAFWTQRGWSERGPIKTESRIDVPDDGAHVSAGQVVVAGVAWAQHTGIDRVEVRIGDGDWQQAKLAIEPTIDSWRQWSYLWSAEPGQHDISVRATDASGYTQTGDRADVVPNGATGWHTISVDVS
ncbi:MAG TPA: molybdopterin-dependent oxidoreductase [Nocardioidaceae bacterium]